MIHQKRDIINIICISFLVMMFLYLLNDHNQSSNKVHNSISCAINSDLNLINSKAIVIEIAQLPAIQKYAFPLTSRNLVEKLQISTDNKRIAQSYIILQKTKRSLTPLIVQRFYYPLFSEDDDDWLILS